MNLKKKFQIGYWNIGIIEKSIDNIMEGDSYKIRWMKHRYRDRFFADPFLYKVDEEFYYILAEELIFTHGKGTIVLLKIDKKFMKLVERKEVISDKYHLSYPNYENGVVVAENYKSGGLYKFYLNEKPVKKELYIDIPLIDPTFVEYSGKKWLFATTKESPEDPNKKLSIFVEKNGCFVPHKKNPVKNDIHTARPGGNFFLYKGDLYRPAQNCEHIYGENIQIMRIIQLDESDFREEQMMTISSHNHDRYNLGLHTFNVEDGFIVVDGFEYSTQIIQKIKNKLSGY
jgi:hypothetical protein